MTTNATSQLLVRPETEEMSGYKLWVNGWECTDCHACHEFVGSDLITNIPNTRPREWGHTVVDTPEGRSTIPDKDFDWIGTAVNVPTSKLEKAIAAADMCPSEAIYISEI